MIVKHKSVILLNIVDEEISNFILKLQEIFNKKISSTFPHITLRGPYTTQPKREIVEKLDSFVKSGQQIKISNVGMFNNDGNFFVYLKVYGKELEHLSWKKDFSKDKYGFNPHITIYKGTNKEYAEEIYNFLKEQKIELICNKIDWEYYSIDKHYPQLPYQHKEFIKENRQIKLKEYIALAKQFVKSIAA